MNPPDYLSINELRAIDRMIDADIEDWKAAKHQDRREEDYCQMEFDDDQD